MDEDFIDLTSFMDKENKPYSPARKRLNLDAIPIIHQINNQKVLQPLSSTNFRINSLKRSDSTFESPVQSKRFKSENQPPASPTSLTASFNPAVIRKSTISIMNVLTSPSEHLRKNRL